MSLGKSKIFLLFCLSFAAGAGLGRYLNHYVMALAAALFILSASVFWANRTARLAGFLGLVLLAGAWRLQASFPYADPNFVGKLYGQTSTLEAIVVRDPDVRATKTNLTVSAPGYRGLILLNVGRYPEYRYGDKLKLTGKFEEPFETEDFSYKNYLSRYDTYALVRFPKIELVGRGFGNRLIAGILALKHQFQDVLSRVLPEPHNALALGLLLGLKRALPDELRQALVLAGVSHIIVISGYNISIITRNLLKTRAWWGRRAAFWLSLATVGAFVVLTGAEASVIRAAIMGLLMVLALNIGRVYQSSNALVFVAAVMIAQNPKILQFDAGFQLSFLATLGLIYASPLFEKWFARLPDILGLRTNLASTLAAQLFTLPLLVWYFDRVSIVAPLVNVLILWVIPYAMFFAFAAGILGFVYLPAAVIAGTIPWLFLEYLIRVVEFFAKLPFAALNTRLSAPWLVLYYVGLAAAMWFYRRSRRFRSQLNYAPAKL